MFPSTPAQYFHCLRRQVLRRWRKPLVVLTPKSLLRHARVVSSLDDLADGQFLPRAARRTPVGRAKTSRILLCSGKVYYDLLDFREKHQRDDVAIVRVEQFYPLADEVLRKQSKPYDRRHARLSGCRRSRRTWAPAPIWTMRFGDRSLAVFRWYVSRPESASPATGSKAVHKREQQSLVERAFANGLRADHP